MFCVYLTTYSGDKLPKFYIGSTAVSKINSRYKGSVMSERFKVLWQNELRENPQLFSVDILSYHSTREEAFAEEYRVQKVRDVVKSELYTNLSFARKDGFFGGAGNKHPFGGKTKETSEIILKFSTSLSISQTGKTKENCERVKRQSEAKKGQTKETSDVVRRQADSKRGRTIENYEPFRAGAEKQRGRSKNTHKYLMDKSEMMKGKTKENCERLRKMSIDRLGKTKENCEFVKATSIKLRILTDDQEDELVRLKQSGISNSVIQSLFNDIGIEIKYSTVSTIYSRKIREGKL
jgi:hypothetical protein